MMELSPRGNGLARAESRDLQRLGARTRFGVARIEAGAELQAAKVDATIHVANRGMQGVALLSQLEDQLAEAVPSSARRVRHVADTAALAVGFIVTETAWRLR